jgi:hypothetical protein
MPSQVENGSFIRSFPEKELNGKNRNKNLNEKKMHVEPFSPGWCYKPRLKVICPDTPAAYVVGPLVLVCFTTRTKGEGL